MVYELDESFDLDEWREEIGAGKRPDRSAEIPALLQSGPMKKSELVKGAMAAMKCTQSGAYYLVEQAEKRRLIRENKRSGLYEVA
jgi:hypothetical protein